MVEMKLGVEIIMKAYCRKDVVLKLLDGRPLTYLVGKMNESGLKIEYGNFLMLVNNKNNWMLAYALSIAEILIDNLLFLLYNYFSQNQYQYYTGGYMFYDFIFKLFTRGKSLPISTQPID
jgi:hypothetical protein